MTIDHVIGIIVVAVLIGSSLFSGARKAKAGFDKLVEQQRTAEPDRVARIEAEMARRGISPPPAVRAPAAPFVPQPAYSPPPSRPQQRPAVSAPPPAVRTVTPVARSVDVPPPPPAPLGSTRRTLVDAFGDPAHARNAVILAEVLAPPVALR